MATATQFDNETAVARLPLPEDGELWSANGVLLAHSRQSAILRAG